MGKMFIQLDEERFSKEEITNVSQHIDDAFLRVGAKKDQYGCYVSENTMGLWAVYAAFLDVPKVFRYMKIYLWMNEHDGNAYIEDWLEAYASGYPLILMKITLNPDKLRYAGISEEQFFKRYQEFCDRYDICIPEPGTFATASEYGAELMDMIISDMTDSDFFLYAVEDWGLKIDGKYENLLKRALRKRMEQGTLPVWEIKSTDFLPE